MSQCPMSAIYMYLNHPSDQHGFEVTIIRSVLSVIWQLTQVLCHWYQNKVSFSFFLLLQCTVMYLTCWILPVIVMYFVCNIFVYYFKYWVWLDVAVNISRVGADVFLGQVWHWDERDVLEQHICRGRLYVRLLCC